MNTDELKRPIFAAHEQLREVLDLFERIAREG